MNEVRGRLAVQETAITRIAREAKVDGLTLNWCMIHLMERLERTDLRIKQLQGRDTRLGDADAQMLRLENEALALVLEAVRRAYSAGADISLD